MKAALVVLVVSVGLMGSGYAHAEKYLVGSGERVLGKTMGSFFVACEGTRVDLNTYTKVKLEDAPNKHCSSRVHVDSASPDEDDSNEQAAEQAKKKEREKIKKILSDYSPEQTQSEPQ